MFGRVEVDADCHGPGARKPAVRRGQGEFNVVQRYLKGAAASAEDLCLLANRVTFKNWLVRGKNLLVKSDHDEGGTFAVICSRMFPEADVVPAETLTADEKNLCLIPDLRKQGRQLKNSGGGRALTRHRFADVRGAAGSEGGWVSAHQGVFGTVMPAPRGQGLPPNGAPVFGPAGGGGGPGHDGA